MAPITVRSISVAEFFAFPNAEELLAEYATESAIDGLPRPQPHRGMYESMEQSGFMRLLGAFEDEVLIGFLVMLSTMNPHYSVPLAVTESFFVIRERRKAGAGIKLLREAEHLAKSLGAAGLLISAPLGGKLDQALSISPGYRQTNAVYFRGLQ